MTNKEWLSTLPAHEWYQTIHWLYHVYGKRWTDTRLAIMDWLETERKPKEYFRECRENDSPGSDDENKLFDLQDATSEAIALLKEQEAVEPVESSIPGVLLCGACKSSVMREEGYRFRHCPWCGKKVKWE